MPRTPVPLRPVLVAVAALAAAPLLLALVLALAGELGWWGFAALAVATPLALVPPVLRHQRGLARIADYAAGRTDALPGPQPAGTLAGVAGAVVRLARRAEEQQRRADQAARANAAIIENLPDPLLLLGRDGAVIGANRAAREAFGSRVAGHALAEVVRVPALLDAVGAVLAGEAKREAEFEQPVPVARSFNAIVERLPEGDAAAASDDSRPAAMVLIHDLTAVKRTEQLRADFVANVSHELRTPLSALIGFIETLAGPARNDAAARERFLGLMEEQGRRMNRLIDDLLSLSRIEMDEHTRPSDAVDLAARVRTVLQALGRRAESRRIVLTLAQEDPAPVVIGDADQIDEVIENLVENAIRYSRDDSTVTVRLWRTAARPGADDGDGAADSGSIAMAVIDQGEGIAREHIPRITERFYRVDKARSRAMGGTGLGLAIVKHIVSRHRATLHIESRLGEGSTFTVHWPAARTDGPR